MSIVVIFGMHLTSIGIFAKMIHANNNLSFVFQVLCIFWQVLLCILSMSSYMYHMQCPCSVALYTMFHAPYTVPSITCWFDCTSHKLLTKCMCFCFAKLCSGKWVWFKLLAHAGVANSLPSCLLTSSFAATSCPLPCCLPDSLYSSVCQGQDWKSLMP